MSESEGLTWSVMIPAHNATRFLGHVLDGVVGQLDGRSDVEIVVVDDGSDDHPEELVGGFGHPALRIEHLEERRGAIGAFNACLGLSQGRFVHILHADDGVLDGFYARYEKVFRETDCVAVVGRCMYIDDNGQRSQVTRSEVQGGGVWSDAVETLAVSNRVRPAAIAVRRQTYDQVGQFDGGLPHAADWEMWARVAASGPVYFVDDVLSEYRVHDGSDTSSRWRSGADIRERIDAIACIGEHLPAENRQRLRRRALGYSVLFGGRTTWEACRSGQFGTASARLRETLRCAVAATRPRQP